MVSNQPQTVRQAACPMCGNAAPQPYRWSSKELRLLACRDCNLVFRELMPTTSEVNALYGDGYYSHWERGTEWDSIWDMKLKTVSGYLKAALQYGRMPDGQGRRLLDVGCAHGFMLVAGQKLGFEPYGLEIANDAVQAARSKGLDVRQSTIENTDFPDGFFDVITAIDVIEHVPDPLAFIRHVRRLLKDTGLLLMVTPDIENYVARIMRTRWPHYKQEHLCYYSRHSISRLCERGGFDVAATKTSFRYLSYDYIRGHFDKFASSGFRSLITMAGYPLPRRLRQLPLRLPTEMLVIATPQRGSAVAV